MSQSRSVRSLPVMLAMLMTLGSTEAAGEASGRQRVFAATITAAAGWAGIAPGLLAAIAWVVRLALIARAQQVAAGAQAGGAVPEPPRPAPTAAPHAASDSGGRPARRRGRHARPESSKASRICNII